jgi:hypothetical protein
MLIGEQSRVEVIAGLLNVMLRFGPNIVSKSMQSHTKLNLMIIVR